MNSPDRRALLGVVLFAATLALPAMDGPLRLSTVNPRYFTEWLDPETGARQEQAIIPGSGSIGLASPFRGDAVLLLLERH